jgi:hypothetical protein
MAVKHNFFYTLYSQAQFNKIYQHGGRHLLLE